MAQLTEYAPVDGAPSAGGPEHSATPEPGYAPVAAGPQPRPANRRERLSWRMQQIWMRPGWLAPLAVLGCFAGISALLMANDPTDGVEEPYGGCALKALTGLDCPGCGGTRAFWYLMHANLPEAARHHVFAVFAAPVIAYLYVAWAAQRAFGFRLPQLRIKPLWIAWFVGLWGVWMVLRNLPWAPFTYFYV
ncbi:MAG: DUF2752 domain-containing protein [Micromonosporaceae bacterium]